MNSNFYDLQGQQQRKKLINEKFFEYFKQYFDSEFNWMSQDTINSREFLWVAIGCFAIDTEESNRFANSILRKNYDETYSHFNILSVAQIILNYKQNLDDDNKKQLISYAYMHCEKLKFSDVDFVGVNDNFPCMGIAACFMFSKIFARQDLFEVGVRRTEQLKKMLKRRGAPSEFASPTYTPIQLHAISQAVENTEGEVKEDLLFIEERLWFDVLARYHKEISVMAAPYSRAYNVDSHGQTHLMNVIHYLLLGDVVKTNPMNTFFKTIKGADGELCHGSFIFMQVNAVDLVNTNYHCPQYLVEELLCKKYPYEIKTTYEIGASTEDIKSEYQHLVPQSLAEKQKVYIPPCFDEYLYEYPATSGVTHTFMEESYAIGTATVPFHNGVHTDSLHIAYINDKSELAQGRIKTIFTKYSVNDEKPTATAHFDDKGRKFALGEKNSALVVYKPKAHYCKNIKSLKLSLCMHIGFGYATALSVGEVSLQPAQNYSIDEVEQVFIADGGIYICFTPLVNSLKGKFTKTEVSYNDEFMTVSFYNFCGEETDFNPIELLNLGNGVGVEVRKQSEYDNFDDFKTQMSHPTVYDEYTINEHTRNTAMRHVAYKNNGALLEMQYVPTTEGIRFMTINKKAQSTDKIAVTNFDCSRLPFMD